MGLEGVFGVEDGEGFGVELVAGGEDGGGEVEGSGGRWGEVVRGCGVDGCGVGEEVAEDEVAEFAGEEEDGEGHWDDEDGGWCVLVRGKEGCCAIN